MVSEGFQRGLKPTFFFFKRFRNVCMIRFESFWIIWRFEIGWNRSRRFVLLHTASPRPSRGVQWWFQRGFRGVWNRPFFLKRVRKGSMSRFESYGGSKLDEIGPDDMFCYIRLLQPSRGVQWWFQRDFRGVWNRVVSEGFQRGLKPCGFRGGLKPCGFRGVSEGSETVWFQRGFRRVWNCVVSEGFQRGLKPCGFRGAWPPMIWDEERTGAWPLMIWDDEGQAHDLYGFEMKRGQTHDAAWPLCLKNSNDLRWRGDRRMTSSDSPFCLKNCPKTTISVPFSMVKRHGPGLKKGIRMHENCALLGGQATQIGIQKGRKMQKKP